MQGKLFPVRFPASGLVIFATDLVDSLLKCIGNGGHDIDCFIAALRRLETGGGNFHRIATRNISLDRYLKSALSREQIIPIGPLAFKGWLFKL